MTQEFSDHSPTFIDIAGDIVAAYVSNNHVAVGELPAVIATVHAALTRLASGLPAAPVAETVQLPSGGQIRKSIRPEGLISFIDGKSYKTLKRHLTKNGLDPHSYRERYGLPADYPMVSPSYSKQRSSLARAAGLGVPGSRAETELVDEVKVEDAPVHESNRHEAA